MKPAYSILKLSVICGLITGSSLMLTTAHAANPLSTIAEQSGFKKTGRYEEVEKLCLSFQKNYPKEVRCMEFGRTPENRPMLALLVTRSGLFTPAQLVEKQLPVTLIQGGIHAGEIDGKDAGFLAIRDILENKAASHALDKQALLFVPVFNIDGHERFGAWNRPNQRGPEEMGWRTTAQNFNLNRDYVKADSPEMQAMLKLINTWDPLAIIDLHVTNGAKFEPDISIQVEPVNSGDALLREAGKTLRDNVIADLAKQGSLPHAFYMSFVQEDDPMSGFADSVPPPRFSSGYPVLRNRFGMLVETHSWKEYATRVLITRNTIISVLEQISGYGEQWLKAAKAADQRAMQLAGQALPLTYRTTEKAREIDFRGYAYTRSMSDISGALMTRYDESKPQIWKVKLRDEIVTDAQVILPKGGYLIPAAYSKAVAEKLQQHGILFRTIHADLSAVTTEQFMTSTAALQAKSFEGRQAMKLQGKWQSQQQSLRKGALFIPIAQPKARLLAGLFEPQAPDALVNWGWFNGAFERKEYMEAYVAEDVAREQMASDPQLKATFEKKIAADPEFAKSPFARLDFFAQRHSSWDQRYQVYPVLRLDFVPK
ncbi:M14 family metallopeptidase [Undibacterium umbellatum]|uniref:M14 family metallopeptidase n=1 Tax=Undibacterium umbellatum TaxID=2762300 RepID=A0ABR6ZBM4_9BURK|nr:M14 family metallopeptidase [Undibacterium umbellatum]MBC3908731.1 M14 family metallopeptidase [Undibacterium umbellatum]